VRVAFIVRADVALYNERGQLVDTLHPTASHFLRTNAPGREAYVTFHVEHDAWLLGSKHPISIRIFTPLLLLLLATVISLIPRIPSVGTAALVSTGITFGIFAVRETLLPVSISVLTAVDVMLLTGIVAIFFAATLQIYIHRPAKPTVLQHVPERRVGSPLEHTPGDAGSSRGVRTASTQEVAGWVYGAVVAAIMLFGRP
jgi:hypothetical protein